MQTNTALTYDYVFPAEIWEIIAKYTLHSNIFINGLSRQFELLQQSYNKIVECFIHRVLSFYPIESDINDIIQKYFTVVLSDNIKKKIEIAFKIFIQKHPFGPMGSYILTNNKDLFENYISDIESTLFNSPIDQVIYDLKYIENLRKYEILLEKSLALLNHKIITIYTAKIFLSIPDRVFDEYPEIILCFYVLVTCLVFLLIGWVSDLNKVLISYHNFLCIILQLNCIDYKDYLMHFTDGMFMSSLMFIIAIIITCIYKIVIYKSKDLLDLQSLLINKMRTLKEAKSNSII